MSHLVENNNSSEKRWELVNFCEFDKYAVKSYCAIHNVDESLNLGDITKIDEHNISPFNMICGGIVVDVLYYIFIELYKAMPYLFENLKLSSFFSGIGAFEIALDRLYDGINSGNFTKPQSD